MLNNEDYYSALNYYSALKQQQMNGMGAVQGYPATSRATSMAIFMPGFNGESRPIKMNEKKPMTIRQELQDDVNNWLKDVF